MIKGTKSEERSVAVDTGSYSNEVTEGTSKRRTPGSSAPNSHIGGEEDEGSTDLGASTIYFRTHSRHRRLILGQMTRLARHYYKRKSIDTFKNADVLV